MHTAAYKVDVASDRRRRENVPKAHSLFLYRKLLSYYLQQKRLYPINSNINIIIIPITSLGIINIKNIPNPTMKEEYPIKRFMFFLQSKRHIPL